MSAPDQSSVKKCVKDLHKNNVKLLIKACEHTDYTVDQFTSQGI